jgi:fumarate reductase subunit C
MMRPPRVTGLSDRQEADRQLLYEVISGTSGLLLAIFMWGHMILVGSILTGRRGFDWMATALEEYYIAQPTVVAVLALFLVHAVFAARKIPSKLRERKQLLRVSRDLKAVPGAAGNKREYRPHLESMLWIWQLRTGLIILVIGSFHVILLAMDVLTPLFGERVGIEAETTLARVSSGLWLPYAILLLCVEFHASVGLYRLAVKWGAGAFLSRSTLRAIEKLLLWSILAFGSITLVVLAEWLPPPLAFLLSSSSP